MGPLKRSTAVLMILLAPAGAVMTGCVTTGDQSKITSDDPRVELQKQLLRADEAFDQRAYGDALQRYKAIRLAASSRGYEAIGTEAAAQASTVHAMLDELEESAAWLGRAEEGADQSAERAWSRILLARGVNRWKTGDDLGARRTFIQLYNYCFLHSLTPRAIQAATLASLTSNGQEQLDWSMRAIQAAQTTGNLKWQAPLWSSHAWLLDSRGRAEEALEAFSQARDLTGRVDITRLGRLQTDWAYGHGLRMVGRLVDARDVLGEANAVAHSIYTKKATARAAEFLGRVLWEIGEIDATQGKKERARERFQAARQKLLEAGAEKGAPELVTRLEKRIDELYEPVNERRVAPR